MRLESLSAIAVALCLIAGCTQLRQHTEGSYSIAAAYPVGGKPMKTRKPSGPPVDCPSGGAARDCTLKVTVTDPNCEEANIKLEEYVKLPPIASKNRVVWTLPVGYLFCERAGDGVFMKDPNVPDDLVEPGNNPKCSDTFEWKRKKADGSDIEYYLRFRSASKICVKDPWMVN